MFLFRHEEGKHIDKESMSVFKQVGNAPPEEQRHFHDVREGVEDTKFIEYCKSNEAKIVFETQSFFEYKNPRYLRHSPFLFAGQSEEKVNRTKELIRFFELLSEGKSQEEADRIIEQENGSLPFQQ